MGDAASKGQIDSIFEQQVKQSQRDASDEYDARSNGDQPMWQRPAIWNGQVFDFDGYSDAFDRSTAHQIFTDAVADPDQPRTTGDLLASITQVDYLAVQERALRCRHTMTRTRAYAHMLGRRRGQGDDRGSIIRSTLEYVRGILAQGKQQQPVTV